VQNVLQFRLLSLDAVFVWWTVDDMYWSKEADRSDGRQLWRCDVSCSQEHVEERHGHSELLRIYTHDSTVQWSKKHVLSQVGCHFFLNKQCLFSIHSHQCGTPQRILVIWKRRPLHINDTWITMSVPSASPFIIISAPVLFPFWKKISISILIPFFPYNFISISNFHFTENSYFNSNSILWL